MNPRVFIRIIQRSARIMGHCGKGSLFDRRIDDSF
jgi:hypothetical protein